PTRRSSDLPASLRLADGLEHPLVTLSDHFAGLLEGLLVKQLREHLKFEALAPELAGLGDVRGPLRTGAVEAVRVVGGEVEILFQLSEDPADPRGHMLVVDV